MPKILTSALELVYCCKSLARKKIVVYFSLDDETWALREESFRRKDSLDFKSLITLEMQKLA